MPLLRTMSSSPSIPAFDAAAEVRLIAELLLRHTARLVNSPSQRLVVAGLCEALTTSAPHVLLAWTWFGRDDAPDIVPQIIAGKASDYARSLVISKSSMTLAGPAFRALRGDAVPPFVVSASSPFEPWRRAATQHGIGSVLALPMHPTISGQRGIFVVYADREDYFERVGVPLFQALAELFAALLSAASDRTALETAAYSDALTGVGNRRMVDAVQQGVYRSGDQVEASSVLMLDLDHFKGINDRLGHRAGDQVLRGVADHLRTLLRGNDSVLRWGGEEFLICIPGATLAHALLVAEKLRASVAATRYGDQQVSVTVSIGVAEIGVEMPLSVAIDMADAALYEAKRAGRNRVIAGR